MITSAEPVNNVLSDNTSNVNEPLVPMVTLPVKVLVTLLNVLVAPSLTSGARRGKTVTANNAAAQRRTWIWIFMAFILNWDSASNVASRFEQPVKLLCAG